MQFTVGRYCEWEHRTVDRSAEFDDFEQYKSTLVFKCEDGEPGYMNWTVPMNAPDTLYYQVDPLAQSMPRFFYLRESLLISVLHPQQSGLEDKRGGCRRKYRTCASSTRSESMALLHYANSFEPGCKF